MELLQRSDRACRSALEGRGGLVLRLLIFVIGSLVCGWISVRLGAFDSWDLKNYQYYLPYAWLQDRFVYDAAVAQIQTFLNPLGFLPFYWFTTVLPPVQAGFALGAVHGLSLGFVFLISLELLDELAPTARLLAALACTAAGAWGPTFIPMLGGSGSDHVATVFVLAGLWLVLRALVRGQTASRRWMVAGAVLIGVAAGLKLTALVFVFGGTAAALVSGVDGRWSWRAAIWFPLASAAGLLISRGSWMLSLWKQYESPLFPFFNQWLRSPYFHRMNFSDDRFLPDSIVDALVYPFRFLGSNEFTALSHQFRDARYAIVYVLLVTLAALAIFRRLRSGTWAGAWPLAPAHRFMVVLAVVAYGVWQAKFAIMRYILPLELLAPVLIVVLVRSWTPTGAFRLVLTVGILAIVAGTVQVRMVPRRDWGPRYIDVTAPQFEDPASVLIVIANDRPWSYLVPFFQPEVRFLGVWNGFSQDHAGQRHRAAQDMDAVMAAHTGEIYLLTSGSHREAALAHLPRYTPVRTHARPRVESVHERESMYLWKLVTK